MPPVLLARSSSMARLLLAHICLASASYVSWHAPQQRSVRSPHPTSVASLIAPPDARPVPTRQHTVALVALGCPKNTVDAEVMLGDLQRYGMRIVAKPEEADIVCTADRIQEGLMPQRLVNAHCLLAGTGHRQHLRIRRGREA